MLKAIEIKPDVFWVGGIDWNERNFHGYTTERGSTYNAYLILDEKITLIDTCKKPFTGELIDRIADIVDPASIDYIVSNHVEMDHSGGLPALDEIQPQSLAVYICHTRNGLFRQLIDILCHLHFVIRDIFSIFIQITEVGKIRLHQDLSSKITVRIQLLRQALRQEKLTVITLEPVEDLLNLTIRRKFLPFKSIVYFDKKLCQNHDLLQPLFKSTDDHRTKLCIQEAQQLAVCFSQFFQRIIRIGKTLCVMLRKDIQIKAPVQSLPFL